MPPSAWLRAIFSIRRKGGSAMASSFVFLLWTMMAHFFSPRHNTEIRFLTAEESWLAAIPSYDVLPQPRRAIDPERLRRVVAAIREGFALQIRYQSMSAPEPEWRWITPHALAFDGYRWHARAFCHKAGAFKDFEMARIVGLRGTKEHDMNPEEDREWPEVIDVRIGPHPDLTENQRKAIELDYGMENGEVVISVRRGFLFYFLKRQGVEKLQLDFSRIARLRADELLVDHRRVREASDARGVRYDVRACLPVDVIGLYVLAPVVSF
ncbi:MAG: WYL domain-containing protein [Magnetococcales bacterium]|nr:WYL domain-containing protein [Magnetococcales bacterium]